MSDNNDKYAKQLAFWAALLFLLGALTGVPLALAQTGKLAADPGAMLGSHLNALLGCFWLLGASYSLRWVRLNPRGLRILAGALAVAAYANWSITALKAFLHVKGVELTGDAKNDGVALLLNVFVVLPTLVASGLWVWGLSPRARSAPAADP